MKKQTLKKVLLTITGLLLILALGFIYQKIKPYINQQQISQFILKMGVFAPLIYILLTALTNVIPPFPVVPFWLVAIAIFSPAVAFTVIIIANILGNTVNFLIARYFGYPAVKKLVGKKNIDKVREYADVNDFKTFLLLRIFGGSFTDYISYAAGFTTLSVRDYLIATTIGLTPLTTLGFVLMRQGMRGKLADTVGFFGVVYVANYGVSLLLPGLVLYKNRKQRMGAGD